MEETNVVSLNVSSYNQIKNDNFRYNLFLDNVLQGARLSKDHQSLVFDSKEVDAAIKFCYGERYKKKLSALKMCFTKYGSTVEGKEDETDGMD